MELVIVNNGKAVTNTLIIAEGTEVQHKNVLELVRNYKSDLEQFGEVAFQTRLNAQGSPTEYAELNERQSTLLLSYMRNTEIIRSFKIRLVHRFYAMAEQLSNQPAPVDPMQLLNDPAVLKNLLLANIQQNEEQKLQIGQRDKMIADLSPKAMIAEQLIMSDEAVNLTTAAKLFRLPIHKFNKALERIKWIYKRPGSKHWLGHQPKVIAGYIDHKEHLYPKENGDTGINLQVVITQKGLAKLALLLGKEPDVNALDSLVADHYADTDSGMYAEVV